jgi:iron complex outermembrane receptor protein
MKRSTIYLAVLVTVFNSNAQGNNVNPALIDSVSANMTLLPSDAPATVSVITRGMIEASGAQTLADAISLAPGMIVGNRTAGQQTVTYLGLDDEYGRRLQVLLNGQSIYTPTTGGVNWAMIPVQIADVSRIEILHGPGSAVHGENAMNSTLTSSPP